MRILITSGGTKVAIDPIRSITNKSTGQFGARIAKAALLKNAEVIYFTSIEGKSPFCESVDCYSTTEEQSILQLKKQYEFYNQYSNYYTEYRYNYYEEYDRLLKKIVEEKKPDVVILAAAVSDYLIAHYSTEKIRSKNDLQLQLTLAPKVIHHIKRWLPSVFLVGFKLLINSSDSELTQAALNLITLHQADLVVANNLSSLQNDRHEILLVEKNGTFQKITHHLAEAIIERVLRR